ncbi:MAG TPA: efflux RND transporter permease subunit [Gemmatimonadales bacterium]|nr:efflux RND transporter permease subunit [Gemmatimonadales bacterium]
MTLFDVLSRQRRFVYLLVALLAGAGVWAASSLPSAIYPELNFARLTIVATGTSLGARQQLFSVSRPIEEAVSIVPGVTRVRSLTIRGGTEINVDFSPTTEMVNALQEVRARVDQIVPDLPAGVTMQVERMTPSLFPILSYNVEGSDPATLYDIARYQIKPILSRVPGVGRVDVLGSDVPEVEVIVDPVRLSQQGMTFDDLAAAIRAATTVTAVGRMPRDYKQYLMVSATEAHSADDIANIVVGHGLRVRDLATVRPGTEDRVSIIAGNGRPVAQLNITRQLGGNTLAIADSVAGVVHAFPLPPGVRLQLVYDQASLVRDAVKAVRDAMLIGAALAVIVLLLFLRHGRITAVSASSIPLTLVITMFVMSLFGQTFNLMTLGAMAIAIGLVIDDAVVITENIVRHLDLNPDRTAAIRDAIQELLWPVTTSTLTTVVVFLPLGLLQGVVGQFFHALSITLTIAVLVSLGLACSVIPLLSERYLTPRDAEHAASPPGTAPTALERLGSRIDALAGGYARSLGAVLRHPRRVAATAGALGVAGYLAYRVAETGFLPEMDEGAFVIDYWAPGGTALTETDRQLHVIDGLLARIPEVAGTSRRTGAELGLFATLQNRGDYVVRLAPQGKRRRSSFEVIDEVRQQTSAALPRMRIEFVQILSDVVNDLAGNARPVEIKLFGPDLAALETYGTRIDSALAGVTGLEDLFSGVSEPSAEMMLNIDAAEANKVGLTPAAVSQAVSGALLGVEAGQIYLDDRSVGVRVRAPDSVRFDPLRLGAIPVLAPERHAPVPVASLARVTPLDARAELLRENQQQMIMMTADLGERGLGSVMKDVKHVLARNTSPPGIRVELGGQYASQQTAFRSLLLVLGLAAASVIGVMLLQFESFVEPLVVLLAAPLSFVGAMALLLVTRTALNVSSFMGLILLVGLIVKNGIILLDFTRLRMRADGAPLGVAIREAGRVRLRPILMTTLCTLFGLLPLALGLGAGSELQRPLALAVIGGLALSTPVTLFVVPTLLVAIRGADYTLHPDVRQPLETPG